MQTRQTLNRSLTAIGLTLACLLCNSNRLATVAYAQVPNQSAQPVIDFERDIAPIFDQHCTQCHGPTKQTADLRLDLRSAILKGAGSGPILDTKDSENSRLIQVITGQDPDYQMPPEGDRLSDDQIAKIRVWIQQGATGPDDSKLLEKPLP